MIAAKKQKQKKTMELMRIPRLKAMACAGMKKGIIIYMQYAIWRSLYNIQKNKNKNIHAFNRQTYKENT
jgi:hypothetical protein